MTSFSFCFSLSSSANKSLSYHPVLPLQDDVYLLFTLISPSPPLFTLQTCHRLLSNVFSGPRSHPPRLYLSYKIMPGTINGF